ncbi:MAG: UDP-N-acetylmuramoyl-L-alanine--D-glutamate ligase [Bacteroidia bacterium]|nr:UDP-N-acetylmuramoyl-L-alanine--D-glutamate ligase [Bacteroidia bacterium]
MAKLIVLGGGESGVGTAVLAKKQGYNVLVSDNGEIKQNYKDVLLDLDIEFEENQHTEELIFTADEVVKSPGIPETTPLIQQLKSKEIPIISEIEFACRYTDAVLIGITGTNGKTTTTLLMYHILKKAGLNVGMAGNVGDSFAKQVAENDFEYYVIELSSFQLDGMFKSKLNFAVLLNITPDHLDRYNNDIDEYTRSKFRITQNQTSNDYFIYCHDDEITIKQLSNSNIKAQMVPFSLTQEFENGAFVNQNEIKINLNNSEFTMDLNQMSLPGQHNIYNAMAAAVVAKAMELRKELIRESLSDFKNISHRLEFVATIHGIKFINDSKATNVNAVWYALECMSAPIVWIVGGVDKGNDYSQLKELVEDKVKAIICLGKDNEKIKSSFNGLVDRMVEAQTMEQAVNSAYQIGKKDEVVLLSPACASFDLFANYEERGEEFKKSVKSL